MSLEHGDSRRAGKRAEPELTVAARCTVTIGPRFLLPAAFENSVTRLLIERPSRAENEADVRTVRDWSRTNGQAWRPAIDHVDKNEPLTWLADAVSGLWSDALLDRDRGVLAPLVGSRRIRSATWEPNDEG
jgi:hypothetical protein